MLNNDKPHATGETKSAFRSIDAATGEPFGPDLATDGAAVRRTSNPEPLFWTVSAPKF
jgi:hypothetical protein